MSKPTQLARMPDFGLAGQTALVTGATSGIGRSIALALGTTCATVAVNHRPGKEREGAAVVHAIEERGGTAIAVDADVSVESDVERMFAEVVRRAGTVHILVNNAGIQEGAEIAEMTLQQWKRVLDVNLTGQFLCAREAVREFRRRGMEPEVSSALGKIICMSSVHQAIPWAYQTNYAAPRRRVRMRALRSRA